MAIERVVVAVFLVGEGSSDLFPLFPHRAVSWVIVYINAALHGHCTLQGQPIGSISVFVEC